MLITRVYPAGRLSSRLIRFWKKIAEPPEIVTGLIHQGSKTGIGGGSKSYKTWILTELAVSVAAGVTWLGRSTLCGKVLYVNLEIQGSFYKKRVKAIAEVSRLATNGDWRKNLEVWNLRGYCVDAETLCKKLRKLAGKGYSIFIVDPIYKIVGKREENSNEQITSLLNMLEQVASRNRRPDCLPEPFFKRKTSREGGD